MKSLVYLAVLLSTVAASAGEMLCDISAPEPYEGMTLKITDSQELKNVQVISGEKVILQRVKLTPVKGLGGFYNGPKDSGTQLRISTYKGINIEFLFRPASDGATFNIQASCK